MVRSGGGHRRLAAGSIALAAVVLGYAYLRWHGPWPGEVSLARWLRDSLPDGMQQLVIFLSYLGNAVVATLIVAVATAATWERGGARPACLVLAASAAVVPAHVLKSIFGPTQLVALSRVSNYPSGT